MDNKQIKNLLIFAGVGVGLYFILKSERGGSKVSGAGTNLSDNVKNKYNYYRVIQQRYDQGWEDVSYYESNSAGILNKENRELLNHDLKEYRLMGYPTRVVDRKEKRGLSDKGLSDGKKRNIKFIVKAMEWRDKTYGNSYFKAIIQDAKTGEKIAEVPFQYGYGDHYQDVVLQKLAELKKIPAKYRGKHESGAGKWYMYERENNYPIYWDMKRDQKKKDVKNLSDYSGQQDLFSDLDGNKRSA